jgi:hypothetical protein
MCLWLKRRKRKLVSAAPFPQSARRHAQRETTGLMNFGGAIMTSRLGDFPLGYLIASFVPVVLEMRPGTKHDAQILVVH